MATPHNPTNYVLMIAEMRRYPQMSYKSDIVVLSGKSSSISNPIQCGKFFALNKKSEWHRTIIYCLGLDAGDRKALDAKFKPTDAPPCQFDKEDLRFVLKGREQ